MNHRICLVCLAALLSATAGLARAGEQDVRSCDFHVKAHCVSGSASVTLAKGAIQRVEVDVIWCSLPGHLNFTCTIDSARDEEDSKWSDEGGATVIANTSPFNPDVPDRVNVTVGRHVSIDLDEAQSLGRCGVGAELPRAIVIPADGKTCRVWWKPE